MARPSSGDPPAQPPLSPFQTPASGMAAPGGGSPYGPTPNVPAPTRSAPTPLSLLHALKRRWVLATFIGGLVATMVAVGIWAAMPAGKHQAKIHIQLRGSTPDIVTRGTEDFDNYRRSQMFILKTRDLITRTLAEPAVASLPTVRAHEDPVRWLENGLGVDLAAPDIIAVTLTGDNPDDLKVILHNLATRYTDDASSYDRKDREEKIKQLDAMIERFKADIEAREASIRIMAGANQSTTGGEAAEARIARMQQQMASMDAEIFATKKEITELGIKLDLLKRRLADSRFEIGPVEMRTLIDADSRVARLIAQRTEWDQILARNKVAAPGEDFGPIKELQAKIEDLDKQITNARELVKPQIMALMENASRRDFEREISNTQDKIELLTKVLGTREEAAASFGKSITGVARGGFDIAQLLKELDPQRELLNKCAAQRLQLDVEKNMRPRVTRRDEATVMQNQNLKQKMLLAGVGGVGSFLAVIALIGLLEWRTRRIDGVDQVVTELGMRVIGSVPAFPNKASLKAADAAGHANWRFVLNESINSTRTMLLHTARHQSMQVVMVTSATQGEGKTSLASQLATSMATAGMRTLIVDCDLRNPSIHKLFDLGLSAGVSEVLCQEADVSDAVQPTAVPNLWVIPAGQCSHRVITALAQGHPLETLFNRLRGQFDFIIVDSCPVLPVADALLIGQHVDGVVFSIMQDVSQLPKVQVASEKLAQLNIPLVGAVVNGIRQHVYSYGYNYVKQLPA